jgi:hypothetical protein
VRPERGSDEPAERVSFESRFASECEGLQIGTSRSRPLAASPLTSETEGPVSAAWIDRGPLRLAAGVGHTRGRWGRQSERIDSCVRVLWVSPQRNGGARGRHAPGDGWASSHAASGKRKCRIFGKQAVSRRKPRWRGRLSEVGMGGPLDPGLRLPQAAHEPRRMAKRRLSGSCVKHRTGVAVTYGNRAPR